MPTTDAGLVFVLITMEVPISARSARNLPFLGCFMFWYFAHRILPLTLASAALRTDWLRSLLGLCHISSSSRQRSISRYLSEINADSIHCNIEFELKGLAVHLIMTSAWLVISLGGYLRAASAPPGHLPKSS